MSEYDPEKFGFSPDQLEYAEVIFLAALLNTCYPAPAKEGE